MLESSTSLRNISKKVIIFLAILISISLGWTFLNTYSTNSKDYLISESKINIKTSDVRNSTQWLNDPSFDSNNEYWTPISVGDTTDVNASIHSGQANFDILGDKRTFTLIADPPLASNWSESNNPEYPNRPQEYEITSDGCRVSHLFNDQTAVTHPSIHWEANISLPVNMSDYLITSASVNAVVNATAGLDIDREGDTEARNDLRRSLETYDVGDYVRFYVLVSNLKKSRIYELAYYQTTELGSGDPPGIDYMPDTSLNCYPEEELIFYLSSVLQSDYKNFTLILGMLLHFEDNIVADWDYDQFHELLIKYVNFTFTYEKKIDRYTSISYNQQRNPISGDKIEIIDVTLDFKYKVNIKWSKFLYSNSELRIIINNNEIEKDIKLAEFNTTYQDFFLGSNDIKSYILPNVNISFSIMIFLADEFTLDQIFTFSIDDVYLTITYVKYTEFLFPFYIIWIILIISFLVIAILSSLSLRSYILIPRRLKKRSALLLRTQKFKDANNIQGVLLIHNPSGLPLFSKNYSNLMEGKKTLFSGFLQAISLVGQEIVRKESVKSKGVRSELLDGLHNILELDFKHFYCLISDIEELRTVLILNYKASKRLKRQLLNFGLSVYSKFSEVLKNWNHQTNIFQKEIPALLDNFFKLHYKNFYKIVVNKSDLEHIRKEVRLSRMSFKILNEILSISEENRIFKLFSLINKLGGKNEDLVIDTIEILLKKQLIIPAESVEILI
ncbi:MAG: hypothetical protein ACFFEY_13345 [Candidatus Thorarchaeota archaeon]